MNSIGIYVGNSKIYITGIEVQDGAFSLCYHKILTFSNYSAIPEVLNFWYTQEKKIVRNIPVSINIPVNPIMRVVDYDPTGELSAAEVVRWETDNFFTNTKRYATGYSVEGNKLILASVEKDVLLDFLNSLVFKVNVVENSLVGMFNILKENHEVKNSISIFADSTDVTILSVIDGVIDNYTVINGHDDFDLSFRHFIDGLKERSDVDFDVFISGISDERPEIAVAVQKYLSCEDMVTVNPFFVIGKSDSILNSNIADNSSTLSISIAFAINGVE